MIKINVFSEEKAWSKKIKKKELFFNKICKAFPKKYKFFNKKISLTLLLSNNRNIRKLNKRFRNKDKSTDVLSFPLNKKVVKNKDVYIGDIIISYNYLAKQQRHQLKTFKERAVKIFIHGFLHLLGFDHIKNYDYKKMLKEEENIYQSVISKID